MRHCSSHFLQNTTSTAVNGKVAKLVKLVAAGSDEIKVQKCIQSSMKTVHTLEGSDLQLLTASLATSRFREEKAWTEIASIVTKKVAEIKVGDLRGIAGSFSFASQTNHEMLAAISSRFKESPESLHCLSWADFIFSLRRARMLDAELLKVAADAMFADSNALKKLKTSLIMAFVEANLVAGVFHQGLLCVLSQILVLRVESLNAHDLSRVALTWGKAQLKDDLLLQSLSGAVRQKVSEFPKSRISFTIQGLSSWGCQDKSLLRDLAFAWTSMPSEKPLDALHIIQALAKAEALDGPLCDRIATCSLQFVPYFDARDVASILLACSQAECTHVEFLDALGKTAVEKASQFTAHDLCAVALAGAKLSLGPILGTSIPEAAVERVAEFDGAQIALMMRAVSKLSDNPGKFLPALERAALPHVSSLKAVYLRNIAMAWAKAQAADSCLMKAVAQRAIEVIDTLDPSTVAHLAWAFSELRVSNPELFTALGARCNQVVHALNQIELAYIAFAFVQANVHDNVLLDTIAKEALTRLGKMNAYNTSLLVRAFTKANLELAAVTALLENLAIRARCQGWTELYAGTLVELSDLQKQYVETVQEVLPFVLVNQRHGMGLILTMAVIEDNGTIVNLEVDPEEVVLSNSELTFRSRRDEFLEGIGVEVLRLKVKSLDDLKYHLQEIFGNARPAVEQTAFEAEVVLETNGCPEDLELQDLEIPCHHLWKELEPSTLHIQSSS